MPFPAPRHSFATKDEFADYVEAYAAHFELPVRTGIRVERLSREGERFLVEAGDGRCFEASNVVVAMGHYQEPRVPEFAKGFDPGIVQLHSSEYRGPSQLRDGPVLIVGAGNSGAEIAKELAPLHPVRMSGRATGQIPFRIDGFLGRHLLVPFVLRLLFHRVLTVQTPMGRQMRTKMLSQGGPLLRVKAKDLAAAGVERVPPVAGVQYGLPVLEDGRTVEVSNVIWCTGFHPGFSWIDLPVLEHEEPLHDRGIVPSQPGLYFVGLHFVYAASSGMVQGVGRDTKRIVDAIAARVRQLGPVGDVIDAAAEPVGSDGGWRSASGG
jgi:putative flavoprotein involved in K+ transport